MYLKEEKGRGKRKNTFWFQLISYMWTLLTVKDDKNKFSLRTFERANLPLNLLNVQYLAPSSCALLELQIWVGVLAGGALVPENKPRCRRPKSCPWGAQNPDGASLV